MTTWRRAGSSPFVALWLLLLAAVFAAPASAKFLEPDQAFGVSVRGLDPSTIEVRYRIADGYYLYREQFRFALDPARSNGAVLGEPVYPKGEVKYDEIFEKEVEHYRHEVAIRIPVTGAHGPVTLQATSQGCADAGLCYPPQTATEVVALGAAAPSPSTAPSSAAPPTAAPSTRSTAVDDPSTIAKTLAGGRLGWIALVFVGLGVLLSFTPCVLPMVPILSSILVGGHARAGRAGFVVALAYSLGLALVYTALGVAAGLAGEGLAATLQAPWILVTFALLLVALSASMFGFYELQVPSAWQTRFSAWSDRLGRGAGGGRIVGPFAMGAISALIVGPCVAAPLAGALVYIGQTRDVFTGGVALFCLAIGMSVPLLAIGLSAGSLLPRVGAWMESVKRFFGALLIAVAIWMVQPVLPGWLAMLAWGVFAIVAAVWLRVFDPLAPEARGGARLAKGLGAVLLVAGAIELVGLATGGRDVLQPLARLAGAGTPPTAMPATAAPTFETIKDVRSLDRRIAAAGRPVLLDFYADWCVSCKEMERFTYGDPRVAARMRDFVLLKADVTKNDADDRALLKRFGLFGPPGIVFFDGTGRPLADAAVIGFQDADRFLDSLAAVAPSRGS